MTPLGTILEEHIARDGPMPVDRFMGLCLDHPQHGYYRRRDPLGRSGDFITAPEISQAFGELIGLWHADLWLRAGRPGRVALVELGPGRGTLLSDLLRAAGRVPGFRSALRLHLVEHSAPLRAAQAGLFGDGAHWHDGLESVPAGAPLLLIANEFLDALPVRQLVARSGEWRERMVGVRNGRLAFVPGAEPLVQAGLPPAAAEGAILELAPERSALVTDIARRLRRDGGAALLIDYGYSGPSAGDTLQAVRHHAPCDPLATPGEADLTAHVDFGTLRAAARAEGVPVHGPVPQGAFLVALGLEERTDALTRGAAPEAAARLRAGAARLRAPAGMGSLFKVMALVAPGWPDPAGFDTAPAG